MKLTYRVEVPSNGLGMTEKGGFGGNIKGFAHIKIEMLCDIQGNFKKVIKYLG